VPRHCSLTDPMATYNADVPADASGACGVWCCTGCGTRGNYRGRVCDPSVRLPPRPIESARFTFYVPASRSWFVRHRHGLAHG
jgi:hypothetical protein